jgi:hypothetical protein
MSRNDMRFASIDECVEAINETAIFPVSKGALMRLVTTGNDHERRKLADQVEVARQLKEEST